MLGGSRGGGLVNLPLQLFSPDPVNRKTVRINTAANDRINDLADFWCVPMPAYVPPLLHARTSDQIAHCPFDLTPCRFRQDFVQMREVHCFEIVYESIKERAESELLYRIKIDKRLCTAEINLTKLGAVV